MIVKPTIGLDGVGEDQAQESEEGELKTTHLVELTLDGVRVCAV